MHLRQNPVGSRCTGPLDVAPPRVPAVLANRKLRNQSSSIGSGVDASNHACRTLVHQAHLHRHRLDRILVVRPVRARHAQHHIEAVPQAGCRTLPVQAFYSHLRHDDLHRHRHGRCSPFRCRLDLRGTQLQATHVDVGPALPCRNRHRRRRLADLRRHAAQVHRHRIRTIADHTVDQALHIQLAAVAVQPLAHDQLAASVACEPQRKFRPHIHLHRLGNQPRRRDIQHRLPLSQRFDRDRGGRIDLTLGNEHLGGGHTGNRRVTAGHRHRDTTLRSRLAQLHTQGPTEFLIHDQISGRVRVEADGIHAQHGLRRLVAGGSGRDPGRTQGLACHREGRLALARGNLHGRRDLCQSCLLRCKAHGQPCRGSRLSGLQCHAGLCTGRDDDAGGQDQCLATHGDCCQGTGMAFGLGRQPAAALGKARHFEAGALLTGRNQHGRWDREHVGVGVAQLHVHTTDGCRRGQRHGHGIRPVDTDRGTAGDKAQRRQVDDFDLRFGKAQRGVACGDAGHAQGTGLHLQIGTGLSRCHGDSRHGRSHRGHAAGDVHDHALRRCGRVERDPQHGDHAGTEPEPGGLDGQGRLTYLDEALLHQVGNADHAPNDLGANGARGDCYRVQRIALG